MEPVQGFETESPVTCLILSVSCSGLIRKTCLWCCSVGRHALSCATGFRGSNGTEVAVWDGTYCRVALGSGVQMALKSRNFPRSGISIVSVETKTEIVTDNTVQVPVQTDTSLAFNIELHACRNIQTTQSDACLTGSVCKVYISPPHSTPCNSALCSIVQFHLCQRWIIITF